jgi:CheY-like chemotaxis protein
MASILVADDNPNIRMFLRAYLESTPKRYECSEAVDGLDAVEKAKKLRPDLIILDLSMPRLNGLETARALRSAHTEVPILLFTLYSDAVTPAQLQAAGVTEVFSKSDFASLVQRVGALCPS